MSRAPSDACTKVQRSMRILEIVPPFVPSKLRRSNSVTPLLGVPVDRKLRHRITMFDAGSSMTRLRLSLAGTSRVTPFWPLAQPSIVVLLWMWRVKTGGGGGGREEEH